MSFEQQIREWRLKSIGQFRRVAKKAVQNVAREAQTPLAKGGQMPVDTGFLRASAMGAVGAMPSGPTGTTIRGSGNSQRLAGTNFREFIGPINVGLLNWRPEKEETFYIGWTAGYARQMEYKYGFMRLAAQNWEKYVMEAANDPLLF